MSADSLETQVDRLSGSQEIGFDLIDDLLFIILSWEPSFGDALLDAIKGIDSYQSSDALLSFSW